MAKSPKAECKRGHSFDIPGNCRVTKTKYGKEFRTCRVCTNANMVESRRNAKIAAFNAYGGCFCACCGEDHLDMLTLDHIDGNGGGRDRNAGGSRLCYLLSRAGFPPGYQVLCFNCNVSKHWNGGICSHVIGLTDATRVGPAKGLVRQQEAPGLRAGAGSLL